MSKWIERARGKFSEMARQGTAVADVRNTTAVMAVPQPGKSEISQDQENSIRAWLAHIGELDDVMIVERLHLCATDIDARAYYLRRAGELPQYDTDDDRITCPQCISFINEKCFTPQEGHPWRTHPNLPRRCARFKPRVADLDRRTGRERWPSL